MFATRPGVLATAPGSFRTLPGALASESQRLELELQEQQYCEHERMHDIIYCNYIVGNFAQLLSSLTGSTVDRNKVLLVFKFSNKIFY